MNGAVIGPKDMNIPEFEEIIEPNDQTKARAEHLEKLAELVGNVYPNRFVRSSLSGSEDTITNILTKIFLRVSGVSAVCSSIHLIS